MNKAAALVVPALVLISLSGCFPTGADPDGGDGTGAGTGGEVLEGGSTACVIDKDWELDIQDQAAKLGAQLASQGLTVISTTGEGSEGIFFDQEGIAGSATHVTYTIVIQSDADMTMVQTQQKSSEVGGNWAWDGESESRMLFDGWSSDGNITTTTSLNGVSTEPVVTPITNGIGGGSMTVSCDGNTMETQTEGSPFVQVWHAG